MPRGTAEREWSEATGLRRAVVAIVLRAAICFAIWGVILYLCMPAINGVDALFRGGGATLVGFVVYGLPGGIVGLFFAWVMSNRLTEIGGMVSPVITAAALAAIWAALWGSSQVVWMIRPLEPEAWWAGPMTWIGAAIFASAFIIKATLFGED